MRAETSVALEDDAFLLQGEGMVPPADFQVGYLTTIDNVRLRFALFHTAEKICLGTIVIVQGQAEAIEKYYSLISAMVERGFDVLAYDLRGQGKSQRLVRNPKVGYVAHFEDYLLDLSIIHEEILRKSARGPFFLFGHSTGGLIGLLAARKREFQFSRMFLSSPMLELPQLNWMPKTSALILNTANFLGLGAMPIPRRWKFIDNRQTDAKEKAKSAAKLKAGETKQYSNAVMERIRTEAPDLLIGGPSMAWINAARLAMELVQTPVFVSTIRVPLFIVGGTDDRVVGYRGIERVGVQLRIGGFSVIPGAGHELFLEREPIRQQMMAAFDAFITDYARSKIS